MPTVRKTPAAENDLGRIVDHIAAENLSAALAWLAGVEAIFRLLATQPEMGERYRTKRFKQVRRQVHGNYNVYYRPTPDGVEILHVIHGARDQERLVS